MDYRLSCVFFGCESIGVLEYVKVCETKRPPMSGTFGGGGGGNVKGCSWQPLTLPRADLTGNVLFKLFVQSQICDKTGSGNLETKMID